MPHSAQSALIAVQPKHHTAIFGGPSWHLGEKCLGVAAGSVKLHEASSWHLGEAGMVATNVKRHETSSWHRVFVWI